MAGLGAFQPEGLIMMEKWPTYEVAPEDTVYATRRLAGGSNGGLRYASPPYWLGVKWEVYLECVGGVGNLFANFGDNLGCKIFCQDRLQAVRRKGDELIGHVVQLAQHPLLSLHDVRLTDCTQRCMRDDDLRDEVKRVRVFRRQVPIPLIVEVTSGGHQFEASGDVGVARMMECDVVAESI